MFIVHAWKTLTVFLFQNNQMVIELCLPFDRNNHRNVRKVTLGTKYVRWWMMGWRLLASGSLCGNEAVLKDINRRGSQSNTFILAICGKNRHFSITFNSQFVGRPWGIAKPRYLRSECNIPNSGIRSLWNTPNSSPLTPHSWELSDKSVK
jgi:hypothetical protein